MSTTNLILNIVQNTDKVMKSKETLFSYFSIILTTRATHFTSLEMIWKTCNALPKNNKRPKQLSNMLFCPVFQISCNYICHFPTQLHRSISCIKARSDKNFIWSTMSLSQTLQRVASNCTQSVVTRMNLMMMIYSWLTPKQPPLINSNYAVNGRVIEWLSLATYWHN